MLLINPCHYLLLCGVILLCAVVQKYHEMSYIYNYSYFSAHFAINLFHLYNLKT